MTDTENKVDLQEHIKSLVKRYGSYAECSRQLLITSGYLHRLASGAYKNPSDYVLSKLGLERQITITYTRSSK